MVTENVIDRMIGFVAPEAGLRRVRARAAASLIKKTDRMNYDAASKGRRTYGWKAPGTDADHAAYAQREQLRNLSRDMIRNRALAARAQMVVSGAVVGSGIIPSIRDGDMPDDQKMAAEKLLASHLGTPAIDAMGEHNMAGLQLVAMNAVFQDGEVLIRQRIREGVFARTLPLALQIEVLEVDWLNRNIFKNGTNDVIEGVEYGPIGDVVAYHFYDRHPGSVIPARLTSTRWLASQVLHIRRMDRPGQTRGVPWLAPVMMTLGEISDYQEAEILKQRMAALVAGVITASTDGAKADTTALANLEPGALVQVPEGSEVSWTDPPQVNSYAEFLRQSIATIATGIGVTYESLSGDLSRVNFSSAQLGHMVMDRNVEIWQAMVINQLCRGIERWLLPVWALDKKLPSPPPALDWTAPRRPMINPRNDVPAAIALVEAGLISRQRQQRQMGVDPDQTRRERAEDMKKDEQAGLPPIAPSSGNINNPGATNDATNGGGQ